MAVTVTALDDLAAIRDGFVTKLESHPLIGRFADGSVTREEYVVFLQQFYHYVQATHENLLAAAQSMRRYYGPAKEVLAARLAQHAREEKGHHRWIPQDLVALGEDPSAVESSEVSSAVKAYLAYTTHVVNSRHAAGLFGQAYVMEGAGVSSADKIARLLVERSDIPNVGNAVRFFYRHGKVDVDHVKKLMAILNYVTDPADQRDMVLCAEVSAQVIGDMVDYVYERFH
jgi:pyrroloquinoline quinone (PQQ) biosynthesis protein C